MRQNGSKNAGWNNLQKIKILYFQEIARKTAENGE
jgi:hypothetical protein